MRAHTEGKYKMGKRFAIVIGVLAVGAVAVPALASQTVKIDSRVTEAVEDSSGGTAWHGRVKSSKHACEVHRKVKVFQKSSSGPDQLFGKDRSNNHGQWRLVRGGEPGRFYAKVVREEEGTAGTIFVCGGDRSKVVVLSH